MKREIIQNFNVIFSNNNIWIEPLEGATTKDVERAIMQFADYAIENQEEILNEEKRLKEFDLYYKKLQPLVDAGYTLEYDEKLKGYYIADYDLYYRIDGKLYNRCLFVDDWTIEKLINDIINPKHCGCE